MSSTRNEILRVTVNRLEYLFFNNAVGPIICGGWHFTHAWKALA